MQIKWLTKDEIKAKMLNMEAYCIANIPIIPLEQNRATKTTKATQQKIWMTMT